MAHPDGEVATAKAAKKCNTMMGLSSFATASLEEVAEHHDNLVLQLYIFEERHHSEKLVMRAKKAGYKAVFLTVDTPVLGRRLADKRNKFKMPDHLKIANFVEIDDSEADAVLNGSTSKKTRRMRDSKGADIAFHTHAANATLTFENDIAWLKKLCGDEMQVWLKGIATPEDALLALQYGVDGIVVSNHGGRQADSALATLDALPDIVAAIRGRIPVHVDGGVRHGSQIFKAIALGADMYVPFHATERKSQLTIRQFRVYIGRPVLWGLAYKGQAGVELALNLLYQEFKLTMALAGVTSISEISKEVTCFSLRNAKVLMEAFADAFECDSTLLVWTETDSSLSFEL